MRMRMRIVVQLLQLLLQPLPAAGDVTSTADDAFCDWHLFDHHH